MDWYWNLSDLLLSKNRIQKSSAGLRDELEKHVIDLYKSLLAYQMRSIYSYYRNRGVVFFRDLIKLDDWKGSLDSIESAENTVRDDSSQYNTLQIRSHLQDLVDMAGSEEQKLRDIYSAILRQTAQHEKTKEAEELRKCLRDLRATDPRHDKVRIEQTKGGLLRDSYCWIFENASFQQWRDDPERTMLWIKADPGKGKTMLVCGIIDELKSQATSGLMSFFFCQATDSRINNATSVLRGLIYLLADQQPSLASHLQEKYDYAGKSLFEDANSWVALSDIFKNILQDPGLETTYLVIDALDECVTDLTKLLDLIISIPSTTRVKWLLSSRNELHIEQRLRSANEETKLSLELKENAEQVSQAVNVYIRKKLSTIDTLQDTNLRDRVRDILHRKANGTFLWVALVIQELERPESWDPLQVVEDVPTDLYQLYDRMVTQIQRLPKRNLEICRQMLSISTIAYRPLHVAEIGSLCKFQADTSATDITVFMKTIRKIIAMCGSFLTVRDNHVYLIHQSAKDYLSDVAQATVLLSQVNTHYDIFLRSLDLMSSTLQRDMYRLVEPAFPIDQVQVPAKDPLAMIRYSCVHWINHLYNSISEKGVTQDGNLQDGGAVYIFFQKRYLYWLEALSLCRSISEGVKLMAKLKSLLQVMLSFAQMYGIY
jgi:hypothetical protein